MRCVALSPSSPSLIKTFLALCSGVRCDSCGSEVQAERFLCLDCIRPELQLTESHDACSLLCMGQTHLSGKHQAHSASHRFLKLRTFLNDRDFHNMYAAAMTVLPYFTSLLGRSDSSSVRCGVCQKDMESPCWGCIHGPVCNSMSSISKGSDHSLTLVLSF